MTEFGQRVRMSLLIAALALAWIVVASRLCTLHLGENTKLRDKMAQIRISQEEIVVGRGRILDTRGHIMAMDLAVKNVCIDPAAIAQTNGMAERVAATLSSALNLEPAMIWPKLRWTNRYAVIRKYVPVDVADHIEEAGLKGLILEDVTRRYYPRGNLACHVIGFASGGVGSFGVEREMDRYLRGVPGLRISERDGKRRTLYTRRVLDIHPQEGADVYLTLDQNLQYEMEQALDRAIVTNRARAAWAVLQRVRTGEILAMASRPDYDLNDYGGSDDTNRLNNVIGYCYEPGSTFKMATIAAALDAGTVRADTIIDCEKGVWIYMGKPLRDFHPHGVESVGNVLKVSSNIGAAKIAMTLGAGRLHDYLAEFGIGRRTGIALSGEEAGLLYPARRWNKLSISRIPMGHEVMVTSLQILGVLNAIANDGLLVKPQIVDKVVTAEGNTIYERQTEVLARPIRADTARLMSKLLTRVTEKGGTATKARVEGYTVAGKTGTAQKVLPGGGYSDSANVASFVGMIPAEKPELALIVVIDEPGRANLHTGGAVCAPVFKEIMEHAVRYLHIPPAPPELAYNFGDKVPTQ